MSTSADEALGLEGFRNSPETSSTEAHTNSGVPLIESDKASSSFAIRAKQAGISDWNEKVTKGLRGNNSIFDGRWVLNANEAWNVPARRTSILTISPGGLFSDRASSSSAAGEPAACPIPEAANTDVQSGEGIFRSVAYQENQMHAEHLELEDGQVHTDQAHLHEKDCEEDKKLLKIPKAKMVSSQRSMKMG